MIDGPADPPESLGRSKPRRPPESARSRKLPALPGPLDPSESPMPEAAVIRSRLSVGRGAWIGMITLAAVILASVVFYDRLKPASDSAAIQNQPEDTARVTRAEDAASADRRVGPEDLPGFDTAGLTDAQRLWLYHQARLEECSCGCGMNVAQCRIEDQSCPVSPGRARELVEEAGRRKS